MTEKRAEFWRRVWRRQLRDLGARVVEITFWDGPSYFYSARRLTVSGSPAELLASFDALVHTFDDCDFALAERTD